MANIPNLILKFIYSRSRAESSEVDVKNVVFEGGLFFSSYGIVELFDCKQYIVSRQQEATSTKTPS